MKTEKIIGLAIFTVMFTLAILAIIFVDKEKITVKIKPEKIFVLKNTKNLNSHVEVWKIKMDNRRKHCFLSVAEINGAFVNTSLVCP